MQKRGFTLLEVLIAGGVLFIVSSAVVGLSNAIVQGTSTTSDTAQTSLWAQEGLELVGKIRDDNVTANRTWLDASTDPSVYGWYYLKQVPDPADNTKTTWTLQKTSLFGSTANLSDIYSQGVNSSIGAALNSQNANQNLVGYRLICIEAYGANDTSADSTLASCNNSNQNDGFRNITNITGCQVAGSTSNANDTYCQLTQGSLTLDGSSTFVPPGNALKVRSVIVWQNGTSFKDFDLSSVLTNWRIPGSGV